MAVVSNLARKFEFLQERAQRRPIREPSLDVSSGAHKKATIGHLKEFYLERLGKKDPQVAARLSAQVQLPGGEAVQPQASGQHVARPTSNSSFASAPPPKDIEDLEIMCNNCFNLIKSSEASSCTGDPVACPLALQAAGTAGTSAERPVGGIALLDLKLRRLRAALEARLQDSSSNLNVMRHLTQLRYHIDTSLKWVPGCPEIGGLSDHTVQQVKQLTATSRVLAPAVFIFSKRIENVVVQKERKLRREQTHASPRKKTNFAYNHDEIAVEVDGGAASESIADVSSIVSEMDSDCGTQYAETQVTQEGPATDVGNVQDANEYLSLKNEDEQRRWFYSQCLTIKLACPDKARARKTLISDLYSKVRSEQVPIDQWVRWIRAQLMPEETESSMAEDRGGNGGALDLDRTAAVPSLDGTDRGFNVSGTAQPAAQQSGYPAAGRNLGPRATAGPAGYSTGI